MRYCVLYLKTKNVNLVKDMGMIPYKLFRLFGYDSSVASYENDDYTYLKEEVAGLKIDFVKKVFNNYTIDGMLYLIKKARKIDVLQIFHTTLSSVVYAYTYKILNPKGKLYIKLDCSHKLPERIDKLNKIKFKMLNNFFDKADLISVEQNKLFIKLKEMLPRQSEKMIRIPNGIDYDYYMENNIYYDYAEKENIILNVARIGAPEKNTEMLLEAFSKIKNIDKLNWKLICVGEIEKGYNKYIETFYEKYPKLKEKVIFKGTINDRNSLFEEYRKAKIFCLTSMFESFGFAFIEAASLGDVIVSTDVGIAKEIVEKAGGAVVTSENIEELTLKLTEFMEKISLKEYADKSSDLCKDDFDWNKIITYLDKSIRSLFS